jgi:release factor glutamine methyltransferase
MAGRQNMENESWTIKKVLDWTTDFFSKHKIENPHLEAEILLSHALHIDRIKLYIDFEKEIDKKSLETFKGFITRRVKGEPAAYITGSKHFMSLIFNVTADVLIPRPETELLIENAIELSKAFQGKITLLDIGTGSGIIAVSLAKFISDISICATDSSKKALEVAIANAKKHEVENKIQFIEADLFPKDDQRYDIIISNPPYIKTSDIKDLQPEIRNFEPFAALDGGPDGLDCYRRIAEKAGGFLKEGGFLLMEVGSDSAKDVAVLIQNALKTKNIRIKKDLNGLDRVVVAG